MDLSGYDAFMRENSRIMSYLKRTLKSHSAFESLSKAEAKKTGKW